MASLPSRLRIGGAALCLALWANAAPVQAQDLVQQGRDLVAAGRATEALPLLQHAVQLSPGDPNAHYALAEAYFRGGDLMNALASLRAADARAIDPAFRQNAQAKAQAIEAMLAAKGITPPPPAAPVARPAEPQYAPPPASAPAVAAQPVAAAPVVAPPVAAPPLAAPTVAVPPMAVPQQPPVTAGPATDFDAADAALKAGDLDRAHILALTGLRNEPRSARGNYLLAEVLVGKEDIEGARKAYEEALNGTNLPPHRKDEIERKLLRLEVSMEPGLKGAPQPRTPAAVPAPAQAPIPSAPAAANDGAYRSPLNAATAMAASGNTPGAIRELRAHLALHPADAPVRVALARYLLASGDEAGALDELANAIAAAPGNEAARSMRVGILMGRNDFGGALADLDALVVSGNANATTYVNRGVANQKLGDMTLALKDYDQAIVMDPGNVGIYVNKASVLMAMRQDQAAIDTLNIAIARDSRSVTALLYRGMANLNLGRFGTATDDFSRVLAIDPGNSQAATYRDQALRAAGERAKLQGAAP